MTLRYAKHSQQMMTGTDIKSWQRLLADRGHSPGSIDGKFGPKTRDATAAFQRAKGLTADGVIGPVTGEKLIEG